MKELREVNENELEEEMKVKRAEVEANIKEIEETLHR